MWHTVCMQVCGHGTQYTRGCGCGTPYACMCVDMVQRGSRLCIAAKGDHPTWDWCTDHKMSHLPFCACYCERIGHAGHFFKYCSPWSGLTQLLSLGSASVRLKLIVECTFLCFCECVVCQPVWVGILFSCVCKPFSIPVSGIHLLIHPGLLSDILSPLFPCVASEFFLFLIL